MFGSKVLGVAALSLALAASAFGRVGPVSQYGQLQAGKNSSSKGQIYGSCKGVSSGNEVAVQGMSFFWSGAGEGAGADFWTDDIVTGLVEKQGVQIVRAPMSVDETGWSGSDHYFKNESYYQGVMDRVVQSAINNDIYVIIDFHSHCAEQNTNNAVKFFSRMAEKWGKYDNVIFEIYNEPKNGCSDSWFDLSGAKSYWSNKIKPYSETVIAAIRKYSDNLVVAGTPYFDQYPNAVNNDPINDKNIAYSFHYYAGEDPYKHTISNQGANAEAAMNAGYSVFVTEWGNSAPSGDGGFDSTYSTNWYNWMKKHKLSGANWAVTNKNETASYFNGSAWNYTESGKWVNTNIFSKLPTSYTACSGSVTPSNPSSSSSSSSVIASSSSSVKVTEANLIDDFEDGDNVAYTGLSDKWFAFTDANDNGASTFSNTKVDGEYSVVFAGDNNTKYMGGMKNISLSQGGNKYDPYVNMGLSLEKGLPGCKTITYKYKGATHNLKAVMSGDEEGGLSGYDYHLTEVKGSNSWATATIPVSSLAQTGWGTKVTLNVSGIANIQWEVKGTASANYLYIDNVACDGMSITRPVKTSLNLSSGNSTQSVTAGKSIASIVYSFENATSVTVTGLPTGLTGYLDQNKKTFTISGTVDASLGTKDYAYTVTAKGANETKTATGTIKVTRAPVTTTITLTSGNSTQSVEAGKSITSIVYRFENATSVTVTGLPTGLTGYLDQNKKTFTISGTVDASLGTKDYAYTVTAKGVDETKTATGTIKVTAIPESSSASIPSSSSVAVVPSSSSEEPVASSSSVMVPSSSSVAVVPSSSSEEPAASSSSVMEPSSSSVVVVPSSSSEELVSSSSSVVMYEITGSLDQTVEIGGEIEAVTITGVTSYSRSWGINFLDIPQNATNGTVVISGAVKSWATEGVYTEKLTINGDIVNFKLAVVKAASSSSAAVVSSSSTIAPVSSSSVIPGSSATQAFVAATANAFKMSFANNQLTLSMVKSSNVSVQVFDMMGNMVMSQRVAASGSAVVSLDNIRQGSYMVRVADGSSVRTARIAVK